MLNLNKEFILFDFFSQFEVNHMKELFNIFIFSNGTVNVKLQIARKINKSDKNMIFVFTFSIPGLL